MARLQILLCHDSAQTPQLISMTLAAHQGIILPLRLLAPNGACCGAHPSLELLALQIEERFAVARCPSACAVFCWHATCIGCQANTLSEITKSCTHIAITSCPFCCLQLCSGRCRAKELVVFISGRCNPMPTQQGCSSIRQSAANTNRQLYTTLKWKLVRLCASCIDSRREMFLNRCEGVTI